MDCKVKDGHFKCLSKDGEVYFGVECSGKGNLILKLSPLEAERVAEILLVMSRRIRIAKGK
jgi:hypothetical protein